MSSEETCSSCGAPLGASRFVCSFCGTSTSNLAKSEDDELQMVREQQLAAQGLASKLVGNSGGKAGRGMIGAFEQNSHAFTERQKTYDALAHFWKFAPLPSHPRAALQSIRQSIAGISRNPDPLQPNPVDSVLVERAESLLTSLQGSPSWSGEVEVLRTMLDEKRLKADAQWWKSGTVRALGGAWGVLIVILIVIGLIASNSLKPDSVPVGMRGSYVQMNSTVVDGRSGMVENPTLEVYEDGIRFSHGRHSERYELGQTERVSGNEILIRPRVTTSGGTADCVGDMRLDGDRLIVNNRFQRENSSTMCENFGEDLSDYLCNSICDDIAGEFQRQR